MADTKITDLTVQTGANTATNDPLPIVDVSDTTMAASGTTKRINVSELAIGLGISNSFLGLGASGVSSSTTTRYLWPWHEDSIAQIAAIQFRVPRACTLKGLRIRHNTTAGNGNNIVYTVRKNSVATALTVTLASTAADGSDTTNTVSFAAGDLIDIEVTKAVSVGTSPSNVTATLEAAVT